MTKPEFQAVVFAGAGGSRLCPLNIGKPKGLISLCNRPMISYSLDALKRAGFEEVFVVVRKTDAPQVKDYISRGYDHSVVDGSRMRVVLEVTDDETETASALLKLRERLTTDFIVLSGDIVPDVSFNDVCDVFRQNDCAAVITVKKRPEGSKPKGRDVLGIEEKTRRLVTYSDVEDAKSQGVPLSIKLMKKCPSFTVSQGYDDVHLYVFSHWVLDLLEARPELANIRTDLIPELVECQFNAVAAPDASEVTPKRFVYPKRAFKSLVSDALRMASSIDHHSKDLVGCYLAVVESGSMMRCLDIDKYVEASRVVASNPSSFSVADIVTADRLQEMGASQNQVTSDSVLGDGTKIGEKSKVEKSIIGKQCVIGSGVRVKNCIVMDHVVIEDGAALSNSILCDNVLVSKKAVMKDCQIGPKYTIPAEVNLKKEVRF